MGSGSYGNNEDDYYGLFPKKQKPNHNNGRRKVPRRGPGVAELEKIRLEEQHIPPAASLPPPPPPSAIRTSTTNKTGPVYQFPSYLTTGSFPNDFIPPAPVFHRKHDSSSLHYPPPMNLPNPGLYQFMEPPLNQTSCLGNNVSQLLDEEKIVATKKRTWSFMADNSKCSVGPTIALSRDVKQIRSLDLRLKSDIQDSGTTIRNPISIDSTPTLPNFSLDFPLFRQKEEFDHEFIPRRSGANLSSNKKPFYSFLEPSNKQTTRNQDLSFSFSTERYESVTDHCIDLRLKL